MLKTYKEFLNERKGLGTTKGSTSKTMGRLHVLAKMAEVPGRIAKQLIRFKKRKTDIKKMIQQAETPQEKAKLKKQLMLVNDQEFEAIKKAKAAKAALKAKKAELKRKEK